MLRANSLLYISLENTPKITAFLINNIINQNQVIIMVIEVQTINYMHNSTDFLIVRAFPFKFVILLSISSCTFWQFENTPL